MRAVIVSIGNELLRGKTVNTNATDISLSLTMAGYDVLRDLVVTDDIEEISWALMEAIKVSDLVVTTGGLGPTFDDMTLDAVSHALKLPLQENKDAVEILSARYQRLGVQMTPARMKMAMLPKGAIPLKNPVGAAPGVRLKFGRTTVIVLPGVPKEAYGILSSIIDELRVPGTFYYSESRFLESGMESALAPRVKDVMQSLQNRVYIKTHPRQSEAKKPAVEIEILARAPSEDEARELVRSAFTRLLE